MDCAWVNKESANTRCGFKHVAETSTLTCGTCEDCIDSTSRLNFFLQWKDNHKVGYFLEKRLYKIVMLIFNFRLPAFELVSKGAVIGLLVQ